MIASLDERGIHAVFHYVPLHDSPAGEQHARAHGDLSVTTAASGRLVRLPLWPDLTGEQVDRVIDAVLDAVSQRGHAV
jgi:dTDP-4-amino-4,6-dideoxygalactose transaminase